MKSALTALLLITGLLAAAAAASAAAERPGLILTDAGVEQIRSERGTVPLFDATLARVRAEVDAEIGRGIDIPVPQDYSGGYTHERHKRNFLVAQQAGVLYLVLDDEKYARYVRDMLFGYEAMYRDLPVHPKTRSYARGKLFWQCLNDSNWLVFMSQAYDAIYGFLDAGERERLETNLFRPFADFISIGNPQFFNRVHNHSTWGNAAVGMIGLVMGDEELVQRALHGIEDDGLDAGAKDNDGGFIRVAGQKAGFLANLEEPFSPDGYYTEGPYYQRYAMYPFLVFAQGLQNLRPDLKIFEHKDGVLLKAVAALLSLSDDDGEFFTLNDAQKGMSWHARELVTAVGIAYLFGGRDPRLLSVAAEQGRVLLDDTGVAVAAGVRDGMARPFVKTSVNFSDGPDGDQGGVAVLREAGAGLELVFKYSAQGLSHGHYDKLSISLHQKGDEVLQDYGMARFVNIGQKGGGNYLPENTSWAKQTIAHNTVTQNTTSHFRGQYEIGSRHHSELHFFDAGSEGIQVVSAIESNAYPGTGMRRTLALVEQPGLAGPFVLDVFKLVADGQNQYDLPFYFMGQVLETDFDYDTPPVLRALGESHGYQHLYLEGRGEARAGVARFSWMNKGRFYTLTSATRSGDELLFTRIGANDPDFNLRRDAGFMIRRPAAGNTVFASVVEPHGSYSAVTEAALTSKGRIARVAVVHDDADYTAVTVQAQEGAVSLVIVSNADASVSRRHRLEIGGVVHEWTGPYRFGPLQGESSSR